MDTKEQVQFYIVTLDNGIREEEPITITTFNSFQDGSELVQLNNNVFGVYKSNSLDTKTMHIDDYDIIKSDIAELLDIDHEETKRIVSEDQNVGVFTPLNYSKDIETRISATTVLKHIVEYVNKGLLPEEDSLWVSKVIQYRATKENPLKDSSSVEDVVKLGTYSLLKEIELQAGKPLGNKYVEAIEKSYLRMILFDLIIGRKYRGLDYYLISKLTEQKKPMWTDSYFGPISVSNSIEKDEMVTDSEYMINNTIVDREVLLQVLFTKHYKEIQKVTEALSDAKRIYLDAISRIIYNNTDLDKASTLENQIINNIEKIVKLQKVEEDKKDKEHKVNKVERTMATQSLNVRVTTKLDLIQKKYPINPKDHPELKRKKAAKKEENLKVVVEKEKDNKGFAALSIIISIVGLLCGLGIGIALMLLK